LTDAEAWAQSHAGDTTLSFRHATVGKPDTTETSPKLAQSRAYSLALAPHLLYSRCSLLSTLVSSQSHSQLEFQAVGSWFVVETPTEQSDLDSQTRLTRVPGGREDVFQDGTLNLKAKRSLMKFLRFVIGYEEQTEVWEADRSQILSVFLEQKFSLPPSSHAPILALSMSAQSSQSTTVEYALPRISRHLKSIGVFGPGFPAVLPKWGGLAEISQVACRAGAVGGGVYVLGKGVTKVQSGSESKLEIHLDDAEKVSSQWLVGTSLELPSVTRANPSNQIITSRTISVISSPLKLLFPATSEGGVTPAGAVIITPGNGDSEPPVYIFAHSSDSGECPSGQSTYYLPLNSGLHLYTCDEMMNQQKTNTYLHCLNHIEEQNL
jgi:RAB protein geranylgeranyltransferase component A